MSDYLIGGSPAIKRIRSLLTKLAVDTSPLVIIGEPGVGKSLLSSRIHAHSLFKDCELEIVNFEILSERDQRVRLLGGSPPELPTTRRSVLELPTTVVLKHIDCASKFLQEQLVNAILNRTVVRLGTEDERPVRCRFIFVFNDSPDELFREGHFIPGLSKMLSKLQIIKLPPLKKRKEDIPELAQHFFTQFQIQRFKKIDRRFIELLMKHKWGMNILELKAFVNSLDIPPAEIAIQQMDRIEQVKMNLMINEGKEFSLKESISTIERTVICKALSKYGNSQSKAAQALGMTDRGIRRLIKLMAVSLMTLLFNGSILIILICPLVKL